VQSKSFILFVFMALFISGCNTSPARTGTDTWEDATLVAEQRAVIERQREYISDLERVIQAGAGNLRKAEERLGSLEQGNIEFKDWLQRVDEFVRAVIAEQRRLEQVQFANSGADAGT
jgi:small-conductance mechanosensitive channel